MKLRFLAAAGPGDARNQLAGRLKHQTHQRLIEAHCSEPLSLWVERGTPLLQNDAGTTTAVGLVFDRLRRSPLASLPGRSTLARVATAELWGSYVLFIANGASHLVLRDPSGSIPVYHGAAAGLQIYASDADMLRLAWPEAFRPNLDAVRHWLRFPFLRTARSGAVGITEVMPGVVHAFGSDGESLKSAWPPQSAFAEERAITSFDEAVPIVRDEILHSVRLLAQGQSSIVLQLSGGLDSSILAAALAQSGIDYRAVTFATRSAAGDERRYARQVARHLGVDLHELTEADIDLSIRTPSSPFQRPPSPLVQGLRHALISVAGSDALLLDGGGGDNVFVSINSAAAAIDALRRCGIGESVRTVRNIAARHGCTFWAAAAAALRRKRRGAMIQWAPDDSFLGRSRAGSVPDPHPWLRPADDMLPGTADHLRMIAGIHHFLVDPGPGQPTNLHPLVAQPIVEACLRTASWLWFVGGRDRAVARAAFRGILPDDVLDRRGKGSLQSLFLKGFMAMRAELRDTLVSGRLAEESIIDSTAIAEFLDRSDEPSDTSYVRILEIASAEQWLRSFG